MISPKAFLAALRFVSHAAAEKDVRYYLLGVALEFARRKEEPTPSLYMLATDGHRLARITLRVGPDDLPNMYRDAPALILGNAAVAAMLSVKKPSDAEAVDIGPPLARGGKAVVTLGAQPFQCATIDGVFPDWRRVFPKATEVAAGTRNEAYFNPTYVAEGLGALLRLQKDAGAPYLVAGMTHHADNTVLSVPLFDRLGLADPIVKIMHLRK